MIPRLNISFPIGEQFQYWFAQREYAPKVGEYLFNHNRSAIALALKACLPVGSRVGVVSYNCHTVGNAVLLAGCEPVFMDVDEELKIRIEGLAEKNVDAVIVTHLFGIVNDVEAIRNACPEAIIIEDCAHARGAIKEIKGDIATFSIGAAKLPSIGDGGILVCRNKTYQACIDALYQHLPEYTLTQEFNLFVRMVAMHWLQRPWIYTILTKPLLKRDKGAGQVRVEEPLRKMAHGIRRLYTCVMENEEQMIDGQVARQLVQAERVCKILVGETNIERVLVGENAFMVVAVCKDPIALKQAFARKGIETETHFRYTIDWAKQLGYQSGTCPTAEYMVKHVLMIPTYREY